MSKTHYKILIVGGGTGGIAVAARLRNASESLEIGLIEPSNKHYYQPLWTLVGGGVFPKEISERNEVDYIPAGVDWIQDKVASFQPEEKAITLASGQKIGYDYLVVSAGMELNWDKVTGLRESIGKYNVCSNYSYETVDSTWDLVKNFKGGTAIFTQPGTPIKCGGAPQKALYMTEDYFRSKSHVRSKTKMVFASGLASIFGVAKYKTALEKVLKRKDITDTHFRNELVEVRGAQQEAVFKHLDTGAEQVLKYDMMHVTPPMSAPAFIQQSPLVDAAGFVEIDKNTMQQAKFPDIFALGDCTNVPTARTGAAIRKQAPVLVENLMAYMQNRPLTGFYNGYSSCPLVTGYGSLILAEFDYDSKPVESFPFDQSQERFSMYMLKAYGLPQMYWNGMMRGQL
ncbi:pyridine nucleotide-disulfide oxidoreductase [bacterium (Candidatus Blackallbacteria) CG17_big_fil_post_rev_8_21_14_2_50_48_46]|uniref:Pyridine nucleotide-disulfide oxidoreductase n=1 Tax=bacterium (Candidatus Blackallbacteria) CG17_big_fil_post_rev_8_21_14_2_50_48_46 TaxID=2014261 RepID=A0A2M7G4R0_9BACT|nr:MAG: pyridine nucleotide-disulfide oxidoreductase [bacterium (Candidatus Blackallbacteria) CG18_big_fil_WC_8_21_14_2_50_49_26]PIW16524.1 MAG: pyridine nucleotide-disulfide oxidoreductase [bacterium (Candidatus Blackallbacteria) CG17_big_fil_post_rev_8_21_14_2_50_48_46]PIW46032.1 MAG: pyridine nucleotide-disulfide oxidoreductase [bacterium (Candidatus Blackallbacteria) CG13_big_fil_rev_8_21_14_2_50_49_14]